MIDNLKKILNEDQDPKAIEKITSKLENLLMSNEEVGYIAVQKKPAITVFPDSVVVTNKRIILCKPKNLGLSMEFVDYDWDDIAGTFVKEGLLGSDFTFSTKTELTHTVDYLPKNQARKLYTYAKEQLDLLKNGVATPNVNLVPDTELEAQVEEIPTEEVTHFAHLASYEEVSGNDYNLSVSTYVEAEDTREKIDIVKLNAEIERIVMREDELREAIRNIIEEIEVGE